MKQKNQAMVATGNNDVYANGSNASDETFAPAVSELSQAAEDLKTTTMQMKQIIQNLLLEQNAHQLSHGAAAAPSAAPAATAQINVWEDDPYSEAVPTTNPSNGTPAVVNVPSVNAPLLRFNILGTQPPTARYPVNSVNFRYWTAFEALTRGVAYWASLLPAGTRWSTANPILQVMLVAGQDLNAFYSRTAGLRFFQQIVNNVPIFSGESPDVVCHELGHGILDALRPQLWNAAAIEPAAFHEAFGDMSSILCALQIPSIRQKVLAETQGHLNANSRLSRLAEQLGWGIRQVAPQAVERDCLRNASNRFFYRLPSSLPPSAPASQLSSEVHSFSRVFTGAFFEALGGMLKTTGAINEANVFLVSQDMGRLLVDGILTAQITPSYFSQVAAAMIQADKARFNGRYRNALGSAFVERGILSPNALASLATAPVPNLTDTNETDVMLGMSSGFLAGEQTLLVYNDGTDEDSFRLGFTEAPDLPVIQLPTTDYGLNTPILVHAPEDSSRFAIAPAATDSGSIQTPHAEQAALHFVEDLIRQGRVEFGSIGSSAVGLNAPNRHKTHELVADQNGQGAILKRLYFDCGCCHR